MVSGPHELAMVDFCGSDIGRMSCLGRVKHAEVYELALALDIGHPAPLVTVGAFQAAGVRSAFRCVRQILGMRGNPKVVEPVVGRVAVLVVNFFLGKFSVHVQPRQTVRVVHFPADVDADVPVRVTSPGNRADNGLRAAGCFPGEQSRVGIVAKQRLQQFGVHLAVSQK